MTLAFAAAVCAAALVAGCGGDDEGGQSTGDSRTETAVTATETGATETVDVTVEQTETRTGTSPEDQPGGAGDEVPASSQALFTGRHGRIRPTVVRVPAYIAIRIELRSADGARYVLRFGSRTVRSGGAANFSGLRPGRALVGEPVEGGNRVRVEATAEPGP